MIRAAAAAHPGQIILLDWDRLVRGHADWLASDGVHLGGSAGMAAFAQLVASVLPAATPSSTATETSAEPGTPTMIQPSKTEGITEPGAPITIQPPPGHREQASPPRSVRSSLRISLGAIGEFIAPFNDALAKAW